MPIHWPSAVIGLILAVLLVVGVSWLAQPGRRSTRVAAASVPASIQAPAEPVIAPTPIAQPALQPTPAPAVERVRVSGTNGSGVNLRGKAGERGQRIKTLAEGTTLELVGPDEQSDGLTWRNVRDSVGATGWVAAKFVNRADR